MIYIVNINLSVFFMLQGILGYVIYIYIYIMREISPILLYICTKKIGNCCIKEIKYVSEIQLERQFLNTMQVFFFFSFGKSSFRYSFRDIPHCRLVSVVVVCVRHPPAGKKKRGRERIMFKKWRARDCCDAVRNAKINIISDCSLVLNLNKTY